MTRITPVMPEEAKGEVKEIYEKIQKKTGTVFNIYQLMGNSPATLGGYLALGEMAKKASLSPQLCEKIALAVSEENQCHYCLAAHTAVAKMLGVEMPVTLRARKGMSDDPKVEAILKFAKHVVEVRGNVTDSDVAELKNTGVNNQELVEIILVVIQTMFSNYFNHIVETEVDFPEAPELE